MYIADFTKSTTKSTLQPFRQSTIITEVQFVFLFLSLESNTTKLLTEQLHCPKNVGSQSKRACSMTSKHRTDQVKVTLTYYVTRTRIYRENYSKGNCIVFITTIPIFTTTNTRQYVTSIWPIWYCEKKNPIDTFTQNGGVADDMIIW